MNDIELFLDQLMAKETSTIQTIPTDKLGGLTRACP